MKFSNSLVRGLVLLAVTAASTSRAEDACLGRVLPELSLSDVHGRTVPLAEFREARVLVVALLGTECPLVRLYAPRLAELSRSYADRGVAFLGVNPNRQDTLSEIAQFAREHAIDFPILVDAQHALVEALGARRTPEVFVFDENRKVCYHGRIDDQYSIGVVRRAAERSDLSFALEELLAGKPVSVASTPAPGCLIASRREQTPRGEINYASHIASIVARRCVECHRQGEVGPFALTSYEDVANWADMIREVVAERRMPPWFAEGGTLTFANNAQLPDDERQALLSWIDDGAPAGDLKQAPPLPTFAEGWRISQPDVVFFMRDEPFTVRASGEEAYQSFEIDPGFSEDRWIQAAEARPGNRRVVHHHLAYFVPPGGDRQMSQVQHQIAGYAPGTPPFVYPPGTALRIPAGSKIVFQMHYTPVGTEQSDRSSLGLVFAREEEVKQEVQNEIVGNIAIRIPPGEADYRIAAKRKLRRDTLLVNLAPHMHLRGKAFRFELEMPDGTREVLLDVPHYDFNWQLRYDLASPRILPAGSRLHCFAAYDNSAANGSNPDPSAEVSFGEQTGDEMMFGVYQTIRPRHEPAPTASAGGN